MKLTGARRSDRLGTARSPTAAACGEIVGLATLGVARGGIPRGTAACALWHADSGGRSLSYAAHGGSAATGKLLLFIFGVGVSMPLLLVGTASGAASARLARSSAMIWIERASGAALVALDCISSGRHRVR